MTTLDLGCKHYFMRTLIAFILGFLVAGLLLHRSETGNTEGYQEAGGGTSSQAVYILKQHSRKLAAIEEKLDSLAGARFEFARVEGIRDLVRFDRAEGKIAFLNNRTNNPFWGTPIVDETRLDPDNSFFREYVNDMDRLFKD